MGRKAKPKDQTPQQQQEGQDSGNVSPGRGSPPPIQNGRNNTISPPRENSDVLKLPSIQN